MKCRKFLGLLLLASMGLAQECYPDEERIDCHPDMGDTPERCAARGCIYCDAHVPNQNVPICYLPRDYGYFMVGLPEQIEDGFRVNLVRRSTDTMFGAVLQITDGTPRWEVPLRIDPPSGGNQNPLYDIRFTNIPAFSFKILRRATGTTLFDTSLGGFTFADQFLQMGIKLPSRNVYGIGENEQPTFRHSFEKWPRWVLWAKGLPPSYDASLYGVHPHYTVLEEDGNAHSVVIVNSNAQEFVMHPHPGIVYRTIGGIFDIYMFLGPTPENTVEQYTELCRFGYDHIDNLRTVVDRMIASEIPYDVQYGDIDIMDRRLDFTVDPINFAGLAEYVTELKTRGIRFMTILDPAISVGEPAGTYPAFDLGQEMDVWIKKSDGTPMRGRVWPEDDVYFPDFHKNATREWWIYLIKQFHEELDFDSLWIDMNEPDNFVNGDIVEGCPSNSINQPPYLRRVRQDSLYDHTLCPDHIDSAGIHYNTHNLYGWSESEPTATGTTEAVGKRTFALSRATFLGSGRWVTHWLGDNWSSWDNLHFSIIGMLQFNLFGIPFNGPDICGHQLDATAELCARWMQLGAFYPFSRNHNAYGKLDQDPAAFNGSIIEISKTAMSIRYHLLPYLYTLLAQHSMKGGTVARALWAEFHTDPETAGIDRQFMWGSGLLITPVLDQGATTLRIYIPDARFFDYFTGWEVQVRKAWDEFPITPETIALDIRGGSILPTQGPAVNTNLARQNELGLIVALDDLMEAKGIFYYDAGDNLGNISLYSNHV
ncbi:Maltase-glucoamylase, intestinal [Folsomia candida]|uniref:Maltase-glucoamylase, intestinal n=1 Tax=Folsomia candida TaxID=158441 RepID=A0A226DNR6_FOLCA|nr:Maltase-glucoamylase, intestinal [Folsomia candida]